MASLQAVRMAASWCGERARIASVLLNVQTPPLKLWPEGGIERVLLEDVLREQGQAQLEPQLQSCARQGSSPRPSSGWATQPTPLPMQHASCRPTQS